jgi:hypothetical protein
MPNTKLSDFLTRLAEEEGLQDRYLTNQDAVLAESGLSPGHQRALKEGRLGPIRDALQAEVGGDTAVFGVIKGVIK